MIQELIEYPYGQRGDVAVCHFVANGAKFIFDRVANKGEADKHFRQLLHADNVLRVPLTTGARSAVVWIVRLSENGWERVTETAGATEVLD